jgi:hypothetical protein
MHALHVLTAGCVHELCAPAMLLRCACVREHWRQFRLFVCAARAAAVNSRAQVSRAKQVWVEAFTGVVL